MGRYSDFVARTIVEGFGSHIAAGSLLTKNLENKAMPPAVEMFVVSPERG